MEETVQATLEGGETIIVTISTGADDSKLVHKQGDEGIDGVKTFAVSPKVPYPDVDEDAVNKGYVEDSLETLAQQVGAEATARANADTSLSNNISAEATTRANADNTLSNSISTEATTRANADTSLSNNISAEATTRANADTSLSNSISAEATTRANADTSLSNSISAEVTARINADATKVNRNSVYSHGAGLINQNDLLASDINITTSGYWYQNVAGSNGSYGSYGYRADMANGATISSMGMYGEYRQMRFDNRGDIWARGSGDGLFGLAGNWFKFWSDKHIPKERVDLLQNLILPTKKIRYVKIRDNQDNSFNKFDFDTGYSYYFFINKLSVWDKAFNRLNEGLVVSESPGFVNLYANTDADPINTTGKLIRSYNTGQYLIIDLGAVKEVAQIDIGKMDGWARIETSLDGTNYDLYGEIIPGMGGFSSLQNILNNL